MIDNEINTTVDRILRPRSRHFGEPPIATVSRALIDTQGISVLEVGLDGSLYARKSGLQILDPNGDFSMAADLAAASLAQQLSALSDDQITLLANLITALATMSNPILITQVRNADGTLGTNEITLLPGEMLTTDSNGNLTQQVIPTVPSERVADIPTPANNVIGTQGTVTFGTPMPASVGTNYVLEIFTNGFAGAIGSIVKSATGFTYTIQTVLGGTFSYHAVSKGSTTPN